MGEKIFYLDATGVVVFLRNVFRQYLPSHLANGIFFKLLMGGSEKYHNRILFGSGYLVGWGNTDTIFKDLSFFPVSDDIIKMINHGSAVNFIERLLPDFDWNMTLQDYNWNEI